ncbi:MAG TPA: hypothetical protein VGP13_04110 [Candidatus Paceibacterota bacterium]|jgi:hypothetical protein|nr:hypothetical protein [Candidatus Paceibacterota bacterium]
MDLLAPKTLEDQVVLLLAHGERGTTELLHKLQAKRPGTTKQGFYVALRKLKAEGVVVVYKKTAALNTTWIQKMRDALRDMGRAYTTQEDSSDILSLADKESVSYKFSTTKQLDNFWGHAQNIIVHATHANEPVYTYDPHYWFYVARRDVESSLIEEINSLGKQFLMTVGGATPLDKALLPEFNTQMRQYHIEKLYDKPNYYMTVIGDYITETYLDEKVAARINALYERGEGLNERAVQELQQELSVRVKTKMKITRNRAKARKLKTKLDKNFYIKQAE